MPAEFLLEMFPLPWSVVVLSFDFLRSPRFTAFPLPMLVLAPVGSLPV